MDDVHNDDSLEMTPSLLDNSRLDTSLTSAAGGYDIDYYKDDDHDDRPKGISGFFFGFMYEEPFEDSFEVFDDEQNDNESKLTQHCHQSQGTTHIW